MQRMQVRLITLCFMLGLFAVGTAWAQPACPAPTIVSADDVPCTVTISFVNDDTRPPTVISSVEVKPGEEVRTEEPRGATGISVQTARGLVPILPGQTLKNVVIERGCCVNIEFDWWTCTIRITKADC